MTFAGWQPFTLIDFPGRVAGVVFTRGCNMRCPFCHNHELVTGPADGPEYDEETILRHLDSRRGKLDGLVVTGGEPLLHAGLPDFLIRVKNMGMETKVDTNGLLPERLAALLEKKAVDYIAMDIKAPWDKYSLLAGTEVDIDAVKESLRIIRASGLPYRIRTTAVRPLLEKEDIVRIARDLDDPEHYRLQPFRRSGGILDPSLPETVQFTEQELDNLMKQPPCTK